MYWDSFWFVARDLGARYNDGACTPSRGSCFGPTDGKPFKTDTFAYTLSRLVQRKLFFIIVIR